MSIMSKEDHQRVVVIQDVSKELCSAAMKNVLHGFSLKSGDVLILFGVLHLVNSPMGYKVKVDSSSMFGVNPKLIADEVARTTEEYANDLEIMQIAKYCQSQQIEFRIEVRSGSSPKEVARKAARNLKATWIILDRQMKKDKRYFIEKLSCGIARMKRDNTIEKLRGNDVEIGEHEPTPRPSSSSRKFRYDEMIPGSPERKVSSTANSVKSSSNKSTSGREQENRISDKSYRTSASFFKSTTAGYNEASSSAYSQAKHMSSPLSQEEDRVTNNYTETETTVGDELSPIAKATDQNNQKHMQPGQKNKKSNNDWVGGSSLSDEIFSNAICSVCNNRRPNIGWKRDFTYGELYAATEGFSPKNFLSEGGFGSVFRGELDGLKIAVKQHKSASFQGEKEFKSEVQVLSKARQENLVMLLGSCSEGTHRLLVYEYVCNGSLDQHLSKHARRPLSWEKRMKIALGAAKGLQYLHENNIVHRDMRPNNILITHDYESLLGDFGLARTQVDDSDTSWETRVVGTLGYLAPEYAECGKVSTKTDVYSFGVMLLQLITGLKTTDKMLGGKSLVGWARPLLKERNYPNLIDHRILDSHDVHQLFWMVRVAEKCLSKDPHKRLTMDKVVYALNYIVETNKTCDTEGLSPAAQSDSISSPKDSIESPDDDHTSTFTIEASSLSSFSELIGSPKHPPPSPPIRFPAPHSSPVLPTIASRESMLSSSNTSGVETVHGRRADTPRESSMPYS